MTFSKAVLRSSIVDGQLAVLLLTPTQDAYVKSIVDVRQDLPVISSNGRVDKHRADEEDTREPEMESAVN
jgi:hypothetical protein